MYNGEYDDLNFEEHLQLTESEIRRRHQQRMFARRNAQLLQQELELEAQLIEENPELAQTIHNFNMQETQAQQQGLRSGIQEESDPKTQSVWSKVFPGLGG
ncbi:hypothetical protein LC653_31185 [Nostoc sp. CHAB 5784]|uniref:hypothetical protein n=1 Tax=Nostoc mirabile TaxID=2907820 RepID=UPI001E46359E|nr:hypothetical protein [Nostoc mirabile]MCC5668206.1 hypothetical protein [Nostoc mirabile CHAB5784]